jgi:hypothetical protein
LRESPWATAEQHPARTETFDLKGEDDAGAFGVEEAELTGDADEGSKLALLAAAFLEFLDEKVVEFLQAALHVIGNGDISINQFEVGLDRLYKDAFFDGSFEDDADLGLLPVRSSDLEEHLEGAESLDLALLEEGHLPVDVDGEEFVDGFVKSDGAVGGREFHVSTDADQGFVDEGFDCDFHFLVSFASFNHSVEEGAVVVVIQRDGSFELEGFLDLEFDGGGDGGEIPEARDVLESDEVVDFWALGLELVNGRSDDGKSDFDGDIDSEFEFQFLDPSLDHVFVFGGALVALLSNFFESVSQVALAVIFI